MTIPVETRNGEADGVAAAIAALMPDGPPRVWSLIVTVFGDTDGPAGFEIGAGPLARLLEPIGVTGQALRVALHRLKRDGWIEARRDGRSGFYRLHPDRMAEIRAASAAIYATGPTGDAPWHLRLVAPGAQPDGPEGLEVQPGLFLFPGRPDAVPGGLPLLPAGPAPEWLRQQICGTNLAREYALFTSALAQIERWIGPDGPPPDVGTMALRVLVVHGWRRLLLRHPGLPDALFPDTCPRAECRARVGRVLSLLPRPSAAQIAQL